MILAFVSCYHQHIPRQVLTAYQRWSCPTESLSFVERITPYILFYILINLSLKAKKLSNHHSITVINSRVQEVTILTIRTGEATIQTMEILNKEGAEITTSKDNNSSLLWVSIVVILINYLVILSPQCVGWTWYEYTRIYTESIGHIFPVILLGHQKSWVPSLMFLNGAFSF